MTGVQTCALPISFSVEFLRRAVPFNSGALDDSETADAADQLLASLE